MDTDQLLGNVNAAQYDAICTDANPLVVIAGAGSGKTRVLTRRIARRIAVGETDPSRVMALTFTRKASQSLAQKITSLGVRDKIVTGTFHSIALRQLRQRWEEKNQAEPTILDNQTRFLQNLLPKQQRPLAKALLAEINWARSKMIAPQHYNDAAQTHRRAVSIDYERVADAMIAYQQAKQKKRVVDFDDLLYLAIRDLQQDETYAAAVRWRHRHFYVDEFQDINPLQFELLQQWTNKRNDLFLVGDPNQAIYSWNGADPTLLEHFIANQPDAHVIYLDENYRSSPQILQLASACLPESKAADKQSQVQSGSVMKAHCSDGPIPEITAYQDNYKEAEGICERVKAVFTNDKTWKNQAVLARTNEQLVLLETILGKAGVPTVIRYSNERLAAQKPATNADESLFETQMKEAAIVSARDVDEQQNSVELLTFHAAKGLEWPTVYVCGLEEGLTPLWHAKTKEQIDEEYRLLYVAVTRAERTLSLSWCRNRHVGERTKERAASPKISVLRRVIASMTTTSATGASNWRQGIAASRTQLTSEPTNTNPKQDIPASHLKSEEQTNAITEEIKQELLAWRKRKARAAIIMPKAVVSDALIDQLATERPESLQALAALANMNKTKANFYGQELVDIVTTKR